MYQNFHNILAILPLYDMVFAWGISFGVLCQKELMQTKGYSPYLFFATFFTCDLLAGTGDLIPSHFQGFFPGQIQG
ncbi:MAG: hypothetical protein LC660_02680 [Desulfobacteraceae bacterium]|nr:hypothetical protein [Desulfobacteraceae bacterium]